MAVSRQQAIKDADAALRIARPDLNEAARQWVLGTVLFESGFGTIVMTNGFLFEDGEPSNNWGARKGVGNKSYRDGCIMHYDADEKGKVCFSAYPTAVEGAKGFFQTRAMSQEPYATRVIEAASNGSPWGVALAMHDGGYYSGFRCDGKSVFPIDKDPEQNWCRVATYARAIMGATGEVARALGQKHHFSTFDGPPKPAGSSGGGFLLASALAFGVYWFGVRK